MPDYKNFDPALVIFTFRGITLQGYIDGTFISAERSEDAYETVVGAGGDVTRVRNRNRMGTVTCTLLQASPTNDLLSAVALEDELFNTGDGPLLLKDLNGTSLAQAANAWIQKLPNLEYADTATGREWVFACAELEMNVGGNLR